MINQSNFTEIFKCTPTVNEEEAKQEIGPAQQIVAVKLFLLNFTQREQRKMTAVSADGQGRK